MWEFLWRGGDSELIEEPRNSIESLVEVAMTVSVDVTLILLCPVVYLR